MPDNTPKDSKEMSTGVPYALTVLYKLLSLD